MNRRFTSLVLGAVVMLAGAATAHGQVVPAGTYGPLPVATFGGTGIPNDAVMRSTVGSVTLGLSATPRYTSPPLTNDGAGTFSAMSGISTGAVFPNTNVGFAAWNFDFFVGGATTSNYFTLFVDKNPTSGNSLSQLTPFSFTGNGQDSWNLGFGFLGGATFNPNATGEYSFALYQYSDAARTADQVVDHVAMNVDVTTTPEPTSLALLGSGFVGLAGFVKRRSKVA